MKEHKLDGMCGVKGDPPPDTAPCKESGICAATKDPDGPTTQAIARQLDSLVPGAHVTAVAPGLLAFVWDNSVAGDSIGALDDLADAVCQKFRFNPPDKPGKDAPTSPKIVKLKNHKAHEIAGKLNKNGANIAVEALNNSSDDALLLTWSKDSAGAVNDFLSVIKDLDAPDTVGTASSRIIKLYNNRNAANLAQVLNNIIGNVKVVAQGDDILVLSGPASGNEGAIDELKRHIALLDLPRPQVTMNLWSVQVSSSKLDKVNEGAARVRHVVQRYNDLLSHSYDSGWRVLTELTRQEYKLLDPQFEKYVSQRFISCSPFYLDTNGQPIQSCFWGDGDGHSDTRSTPDTRGSNNPQARLTRTDLNACPYGQYCLGFTQAFHPRKSSPTNLFFVLASTAWPGVISDRVVECMESVDDDCGRKEAEAVRSAIRILYDTRSLWQTVECAEHADANCGNEEKKAALSAIQTLHERRILRQDAECKRADADCGKETEEAASSAMKILEDSKILPQNTHRNPCRFAIEPDEGCVPLNWNIFVKLYVPAFNELGPCAQGPSKNQEEYEQLKRIQEREKAGFAILRASVFGASRLDFHPPIPCLDRTEENRNRWEGEEPKDTSLRLLRVFREDCDCEKLDEEEYLQDDPSCAEAGEETPCSPGSSSGMLDLSKKPEKLLHLNCFRHELRNVFQSSRKTGLLRAALADFLFHYKMSIQYPHDFVPYDLSHSADTLDSNFQPLLAAYNRDLAALLRHLQQYRINGSDFASEGILTVAALSSKAASVEARTVNSFEGITPFTFTEFLNQLKAAQGNTPDLLKLNLSADEANALVAAFNVQKSFTVNIGRDLSLSATANTLATGSAAELKVVMASKDDGQPQQTFQDGTKKDINPSRVAAHTVDTTVRLESVKLFELSSLSARLYYRGNSWPVPVLGEFPIIGPAFRFPGLVHKVYHRSFAIMSAVIVPNASDLAEGISFTGDRMLSVPVPLFKICKNEPAAVCDKNPAICAKAATKCDSIESKRNDPSTEGRMFDPNGYYHTRTVPLESIRELPP